MLYNPLRPDLVCKACKAFYRSSSLLRRKACVNDIKEFEYKLKECKLQQALISARGSTAPQGIWHTCLAGLPGIQTQVVIQVSCLYTLALQSPSVSPTYNKAPAI